MKTLFTKTFLLLLLMGMISGNVTFAKSVIFESRQDPHLFSLNFDQNDAEHWYKSLNVAEQKSFKQGSSHEVLDYTVKSYSSLDGSFSIRCTKTPYGMMSDSYVCDGNLNFDKDDDSTNSSALFHYLVGDSAADLTRVIRFTGKSMDGRFQRENFVDEMEITCDGMDGPATRCLFNVFRAE